MARLRSKHIKHKRYYAFKEYIIYEGQEVIFFIGLTTNNSRIGHNGMYQFHQNIPCWKEVTDTLITELGDFADMRELNKVYKIKRSYGNYYINYYEAKKKFYQMLNDNSHAACYNFVECIGPEQIQDSKYIWELEISDDSSQTPLTPTPIPYIKIAK